LFASKNINYDKSDRLINVQQFWKVLES